MGAGGTRRSPCGCRRGTGAAARRHGGARRRALVGADDAGRRARRAAGGRGDGTRRRRQAARRGQRLRLPDRRRWHLRPEGELRPATAGQPTHRQARPLSLRDGPARELPGNPRPRPHPLPPHPAWRQGAGERGGLRGRPLRHRRDACRSVLRRPSGRSAAPTASDASPTTSPSRIEPGRHGAALRGGSLDAHRRARQPSCSYSNDGRPTPARGGSDPGSITLDNYGIAIPET